eukprot:CAMPEP_0178543200 /NCGR_PEP_ID=MMETSP0697-20121206/2457_1 /TAXON_ID=265572 /ORGANISM="Extubocellulus spinifer, Strain CCMP396" /LENGTH=50 /DNA_ID=CAMNT_0020175635 /DNA_START=90 /DNA_END=239 /DNA_ORIENTATION=-
MPTPIVPNHPTADDAVVNPGPSSDPPMEGPQIGGGGMGAADDADADADID